MIRTISAALLFAFAVLFSACSVNIFDSFGNHDSDEALVFKARRLMIDRDYATAIAQFPLMSASVQNRRDVLALRASAYAGRAGLDTLALSSALSSYAGTSFFLFLMQNFEGGVALDQADLLTARNYMLSITSTPSSYTNDELVELAVISLANMGTILSRYADPLDSNGTPDAGFDPCANIPSAAAPNDAAQSFAVSLNLATAAMGQLSTNGVSFGPAVATGATAACGLLVGPIASYNFCNIYSESLIVGNMIKGVLSLINESSAGIGIGASLAVPCAGDIAACACP